MQLTPKSETVRVREVQGSDGGGLCALLLLRVFVGEPGKHCAQLLGGFLFSY